MTRDERDFRNWLAGFFEADGSMGMYARRTASGKYDWRLVIYQKDITILRDIERHVGGQVRVTVGNRRIQWRGRDAVRMARYLLPFLRHTKRQQAERFLDAVRRWGNESRNGRGGKISDVLVATHEMLANSVNTLNHAYRFRNGPKPWHKKTPSEAPPTLPHGGDRVTVVHQPR